ncbi:MAG: MerR family transcriptional regulator [Firmicutes bacterium]|nr:MerR family transcriptional regulator [Bacillota bacterium]
MRNCPECGKVFAFVTRNLCPDCLEKEEISFQRVEKYLEENPGATVLEVSRATGVSEQKIVSFLREGRLIPAGQPLLECERCRKPISSGRFCPECRAALSSSLKDVSHLEGRQPGQAEERPLVRRQEQEAREKVRMHTADRYRKTRR